MDPYALTWDSVPVLRRRVAGVALLALLVLVVVPLLLSGREASAAAPAPSVGIGDAWVVEPSAGTTASADFALRLNRPAAGSESVQWAASSGTAGTSDFVVGSGTVTFPAGSKQQS